MFINPMILILRFLYNINERVWLRVFIFLEVFYADSSFFLTIDRARDNL